MPSGIHDHIMRLCALARQVVFGDDHAGRAAREPRERLDWKFQAFRVAQIYAGQVVGHLLLDRLRHGRTVGVVAARDQELKETTAFEPGA